MLTVLECCAKGDADAHTYKMPFLKSAVKIAVDLADWDEQRQGEHAAAAWLVQHKKMRDAVQMAYLSVKARGEVGAPMLDSKSDWAICAQCLHCMWS